MTAVIGEKRLRLRKNAQPIRNPSAAYSKKCANLRTMKLFRSGPKSFIKIPRTLSLIFCDWLPSLLESQNMHPAHAAANNQKKTASTMRTVRFSGSIYLSLFSFSSCQSFAVTKTKSTAELSGSTLKPLTPFAVAK